MRAGVDSPGMQRLVDQVVDRLDDQGKRLAAAVLDISTLTTKVDAPAAVEAPTAEAVPAVLLDFAIWKSAGDGTKVTIGVQVQPAPGSPIDSVRIYAQNYMGNADWAMVASSTAWPLSFTMLQTGELVTLKAVAVNGAQESGDSATINVTLNATATRPAKLMLLDIATLTTGVQLGWLAGPETDLNGFAVFRALRGSGPELTFDVDGRPLFDGNWTWIAPSVLISPGTRRYTWLDPDGIEGQYVYFVAAANPTGWGPPSEYIFPPAAMMDQVADGTTFRKVLYVNSDNLFHSSAALNPQGSILPNQPIIITYSFTASQIVLSWAMQSLLRGDNTTLVLLAGSITYTGLSGSTEYYIYSYIRVSDGALQFTNPDPPPSTPSAVMMTQTALDGRIPIPVMSVTTAAGGGTGGGTGGGGDLCPEANELVMVRDRGQIKAIEVLAGDWIQGRRTTTGEAVWRLVIGTSSVPCAAWRMIAGHRVSPCEPVFWEGKWVLAYRVPGAVFDELVSAKTVITVEADRYDEANYELQGETPLLIHNFGSGGGLLMC